jgi:hypothetical protein
MKSQQTKEQLVNQLVGLINGSVSKDELRPKDLCICIGYGTDNIYLINSKESTKEEFDKARALQPPTAFNITYDGKE